MIFSYPRSNRVSHRGGAPVGIQAIGRAFTARSSQHARLFQHQVLHVAQCRGASQIEF